jgi:sterol desaturase/sphingolipid hydroxylase (fatty acid hydroxylase superfamily)
MEVLTHHRHLGAGGIALFVAAVVIEAALLQRRGRAYAWRDAGSSVVVGLVQRMTAILWALVLIPLLDFVWAHRVATFTCPPPLQALGSLLAVEFAYYWTHRWSHGIAWMWATHSVHHSSEQLNFTAAIRVGAKASLSGEWLPFVPLVWIGIAPSVVFGLLGLGLLYQFFLHTEIVPKLGPLEWVLNTPSHHRVHHAVNPAYRDKNFGGMLIIFDRLFGTHARERETDAPRYGLAGERRGRDPLRILLGGWRLLIGRARAARRPRELLAVLFGSP